MRRDILFGMVASVAFHGGFVGLGEWMQDDARLWVRSPDDLVMIMPMPPPELDEPELIEDRDPTEIKKAFLAPTLPERPSTPKPGDIVQPWIPVARGDLRIGPAVIPVAVTSAGDQVFDPDKLDQLPRAVLQGRPAYPYSMRITGVTGVVSVEFVVDARGNVSGAYAVRSSQREFEAEAVKAVNGWKFKAGRKAGSPVATRMVVDIQFKLND